MRVGGSALLNVAVILILISCQQRLPCQVESFLVQLGEKKKRKKKKKKKKKKKISLV